MSMDFPNLLDKADQFLARRNAEQAAQAQTPAPTAGAEQTAASAEPGPVITHGQPILSGGADGEPVKQLVKLLEVCGFANNSIAKGENADGILDATVMSDVRAFCDKYDVHEDDTLYSERVPVADLRGRWVGPNIWQALYDHAEQIINQGS